MGDAQLKRGSSSPGSTVCQAYVAEPSANQTRFGQIPKCLLSL